MGRLIDRLVELPWYHDRDAFESLATSIVGQQLSTSAASTIQARVEALIGEWAPEAILAHDHDELRATGLSNSKVRFLLDLSQRVASGDLDLDVLDGLSDEEVIAELTRVKGIGRWTAEMFLIFWFDRPDVFSMGDAGLRAAIAEYWGVDARDDGAIRRIQSRWEPYRSLASRILWRSRYKLPA